MWSRSGSRGGRLLRPQLGPTVADETDATIVSACAPPASLESSAKEVVSWCPGGEVRGPSSWPVLKSLMIKMQSEIVTAPVRHSGAAVCTGVYDLGFLSRERRTPDKLDLEAKLCPEGGAPRAAEARRMVSAIWAATSANLASQCHSLEPTEPVDVDKAVSWAAGQLRRQRTPPGGSPLRLREHLSSADVLGPKLLSCPRFAIGPGRARTPLARCLPDRAAPHRIGPGRFRKVRPDPPTLKLLPQACARREAVSAPTDAQGSLRARPRAHRANKRKE